VVRSPGGPFWFILHVALLGVGARFPKLYNGCTRLAVVAPTMPNIGRIFLTIMLVGNAEEKWRKGDGE
jgi:hypothetical protein